MNEKNAYADVVEEILLRSDRLGDKIVCVWTSVLGESNEILLYEHDQYVWQNDWYEGGEFRLIGWTELDEVEMHHLA